MFQVIKSFTYQNLMSFNVLLANFSCHQSFLCLYSMIKAVEKEGGKTEDSEIGRYWGYKHYIYYVLTFWCINKAPFPYGFCSEYRNFKCYDWMFKQSSQPKWRLLLLPFESLSTLGYQNHISDTNQNTTKSPKFKQFFCHSKSIWCIWQRGTFPLYNIKVNLCICLDISTNMILKISDLIFILESLQLLL